MRHAIQKDSIGGLQLAANTLQWNIVDGLDQHLLHPVEIVSCLFIGSFPKSHRWKRVRGETFSHTQNSADIVVGYCNHTLCKQVSMVRNTWACVNKVLQNKSNRPDVLLVYSTNMVCLETAARAKRKYPDVRVVIIVPDLMKFTSQHLSPYSPRAVYRNFLDGRAKKHLPGLDGYIFLTDAMADYFQVSKEYMVMEGVADRSVLTAGEAPLSHPDSGVKRVVYTGGLRKAYGIMDLLDAFAGIRSPEYELVICGEGELASTVKEYSRADERIRYLGLLPREEILAIQKNATVLVNPRRNEGEYTSFSFPSKLIEYMSSGVPVLCHKLDGIPDEYDQYIASFKGNRIEDVRTGIQSVCEMEQAARNRMGANALEFIKSEKVADRQMEKVIVYLQKIIDGEKNG